MTLKHAYKLGAICALQKQAFELPMVARNALYGGALGAGLGGLYSKLRGDDSSARSMLAGGALGALGAGLGGSLLTNSQPVNPITDPSRLLKPAPPLMKTSPLTQSAVRHMNLNGIIDV